MKYKTLVVTEQSAGINLLSRERGIGAYVNAVTRAAECSDVETIKSGDILLSVNETDTTTLSLQAIAKLCQQADRPMRMMFQEPPLLIDITQLFVDECLLYFWTQNSFSTFDAAATINMLAEIRLAAKLYHILNASPQNTGQRRLQQSPVAPSICADTCSATPPSSKSLPSTQSLMTDAKPMKSALFDILTSPETAAVLEYKALKATVKSLLIACKANNISYLNTIRIVEKLYRNLLRIIEPNFQAQFRRSSAVNIKMMGLYGDRIRSVMPLHSLLGPILSCKKCMMLFFIFTARNTFGTLELLLYTGRFDCQEPEDTFKNWCIALSHAGAISIDCLQSHQEQDTSTFSPDQLRRKLEAARQYLYWFIVLELFPRFQMSVEYKWLLAEMAHPINFVKKLETPPLLADGALQRIFRKLALPEELHAHRTPTLDDSKRKTVTAKVFACTFDSSISLHECPEGDVGIIRVQSANRSCVDSPSAECSSPTLTETQGSLGVFATQTEDSTLISADDTTVSSESLKIPSTSHVGDDSTMRLRTFTTLKDVIRCIEPESDFEWRTTSGNDIEIAIIQNAASLLLPSNMHIHSTRTGPPQPTMHNFVVTTKGNVKFFGCSMVQYRETTLGKLEECTCSDTRLLSSESCASIPSSNLASAISPQTCDSNRVNKPLRNLSQYMAMSFNRISTFLPTIASYSKETYRRSQSNNLQAKSTGADIAVRLDEDVKSIAESDCSHCTINSGFVSNFFDNNVTSEASTDESRTEYVWKHLSCFAAYGVCIISSTPSINDLRECLRHCSHIKMDNFAHSTLVHTVASSESSSSTTSVSTSSDSDIDPSCPFPSASRVYQDKCIEQLSQPRVLNRLTSIVERNRGSLNVKFATDIDPDIILSLCSARTIVIMFMAMLLEQKLAVVISSGYTTVTVLGEWLQKCIRPLEWSHVHAPVLSATSSVALLDCPTPYFIGIQRGDLSADTTVPDDVLCVDLDHNSIVMTEDMECYVSCLSRLILAVQVVLDPPMPNTDSISYPPSSLPSSTKVKLEYQQEFESGEVGGRRSKAQMVEAIFTGFVQELLQDACNYCMYCDDEDEGIILFDMKGFELRKLSKKTIDANEGIGYRQLLKALSSTQSFSQYLLLFVNK